MIDFKLDPPSGFADSYLDIRFIVTCPKSEEISVQLFNQTTNSPIEILGLDKGFISNETIAKDKNTNSVKGFINLFNKDKMNTSLRDLDKVDIKCTVSMKNGSKVESEEKVVSFYNQSKSVDSNISPFDLILESNIVDIKEGKPFRIYLISGESKRYELVIMSEDQRSKCVIEVFAKEGKTEIEIPIEYIYTDLQLDRNFIKKFHIYWTKFEGVDFSKHLKRKYVKLDNTQLSFNDKKITLKPQERNGPLGVLSDDFALSDRYYVHTYKKFTALGELKHSDKRMDMMSRLSIEAQAIDRTKTEVFSDNKNEIRQTVRSENMKKKFIKTYKKPKKQDTFIETFQSSYNDKEDVMVSKEIKIMSSSQPKKAPKKGGCGCSRKR